MKELVPFAVASSTDITGGHGDAVLTVETDQDSLVLSGSAEFRKDAEGRAGLLRLAAIISRALEEIGENPKPATAEDTKLPAHTVPNPFG